LASVAVDSEAAFALRAQELADAAHSFYAEERFVQARQSACCAERVYATLLERQGELCSDEHCAVAHIYPGADSIGEYEALLSGDRRRRVGEERAYALARSTSKAQERAAGEDVLLFEECGNSVHGSRVPDNDGNDAVFALRASSAVDPVSGAWISSVIHVRPLAHGSRNDAALEMNLAAAGVPDGSRVLLVRYGARKTSVDCFTAGAKGASVECPATTTARLFLSLHAALPATEGADAPEVNTRANEPHAAPEHRVSLFLSLPDKTLRAPSLQLAFVLRARGGRSICTVNTAGGNTGGGFAALAPAPFVYAREGVPLFINATQLPKGGLCVGGDSARVRCDEAQECAGGYCEMKGASAYHCVDAPAAGVNLDALCSRRSQCPYGRCYGHASEQGAYPALGEFLESRGARAANWFEHRVANERSTYYERL
jgi:hypothetical protein